MKAMIWKELRECGTWAVLAGAVWCIFNYFGYHTMFSTEDVIRDPLRIWEGKIILNVVLGAVAGGMLGVIQILPELRRDQWAFLLHRPASATTLFAGKAIAGILMLIAIISISEAFGYYLLRFHLKLEIVSFWYLAVAVSIGILAGAVFYFSAVIAALRPAKVFGSRLLSLITALAIVVVLFLQPSFWQVLLCTVLCLIGLVLAAQSCFEAKGEYRRMKTVGRVALGSTLLAGGSIFGMGVIAFLSALVPRGFVATYFDSHNLEPYSGSYYRSDYYNLYDQFMDSQYYSYSVAYDLGRNVSMQMLKNTREVRAETRTAVVTKPAYRQYGRYIKRKEEDDIFSYYDTVGKRIVFYSMENRRIIGYSGPNGYYDVNHIPADGSAQFSGELLSDAGGNYLCFTDAVFQVDSSGRQIKRLIDGEADQPFQNVVPVNVGKIQRFWVVKSNAIEQYDAEGKRLLSVPLGPEERDGQYIGAVSVDADKHFLWFGRITKTWPGVHHLDSKCAEVTGTGKVLSRFEIDFGEQEGDIVVPFNMMFAGVVWPMLRNDTHLLSQQNWVVIDQLYGVFYRASDIVVSINTLIAAICLSVMSAWLFARRARLKLSLCCLWMGLTLLFGAVALIGLLALYPWPGHLACGQCKKLRDIENEECPHCHVPWPRPQRDGTEIISRDFQSHALASGGQE